MHKSHPSVSPKGSKKWILILSWRCAKFKIPPVASYEDHCCELQQWPQSFLAVFDTPRSGVKTSRRILLIQPFQKWVFDGFIHGLNHCNDIVAAPKGCMTWAKKQVEAHQDRNKRCFTLPQNIAFMRGFIFLLIFLGKTTISDWNLNPGIYPYPHPKSSYLAMMCGKDMIFLQGLG